ncbi:uncharacterized protein LOC110452589 [Mizuhopecten yessoensis]|uniref:DUF218 domain-containing protein n=1 Tax=Mizuhopecten yessoensis TaxID=6573 RepID=A0A210QJM6_MIZYE|nr:uncharacterized protein LOC110452589 [Mizuhopecten yessoensis]OWF48811.1 hypothetical protein KP79_PYT14603 [Mizuhopecten yessoensis]
MMRRANGLVMRSLRYGHVRLWKMFCNNPVPDKDLTAAQTIWDYMILNHTPRKSDIILVLGNHDVRTADYASNLFLDGKADCLLFSGKVGVLTRGKWRKTEAEIFRDIALTKGVPEERILLELQATNTGENVAFSYDVLEAKNLLENLKSIILVQMPHMERRVYATFMKQWTGDPTKLDVTVTSPPIPLRKYPNPDVGSLKAVITVMMGCMYRLKVYPETGFQIYQHIPDVVWDSYLSLLRSGKYNGHIPL